jgi:group II intron reverse transcriptase/maturase
VPTPFHYAEGNITGGDTGEPPVDPAQSETLSMRGNSSLGNREIPGVPAADATAGRPEKAEGRTSGMNARGKSDDRVVPEKRPNKSSETPPAEDVEGRRSTKGNTSETAAHRAQNRKCASIGLRGVREKARRDKRARFTTLLHHVNVDRLKKGFYELKRQAAPGIDGVTWERYEKDLEENITDLHDRVHSGKYRAQPSRRTYIPKPDGRKRPLGVTSLEDKIVQQALVTVLNQIYEEDFLGFSYGFRRGRSPHNALDALTVGIVERKVNWVLDADIRGFFDNIDHEWMMKFIEHRIADPRVLRLIRKWLRAGVSEDGEWSRTTVGTPQGAVVSPLLANIYLHYVLDLWTQDWRRKRAHGDMVVVRYADDFVLGFQHKGEAERYRKDLESRLKEFGLALNPEKTRLIEFGRYASSNRKKKGKGKPETFDFLGFTHMCGKTRKSGKFTVRRKTIKKRLRAKLKMVKERLLRNRHEPLPKLLSWLRSVVTGHMNYFAVPDNYASIHSFRRQAIRELLHALRRRSQKHKMTWDLFGSIVDGWIPKAGILHPYPATRFHANHPR